MRKLLFDAVSDAVSPESHTILSTELLLKGDYIRSGDNLIIKGKMGEEVVVEGYFSGESSPILVSPLGHSSLQILSLNYCSTAMPFKWQDLPTP